MPKEKKIAIYSYDELSRDAKERAKEDVRNFYENILDSYLESFNEEAKEQIEKEGFSDVDINYSLSYSQGDGFSFTGYVGNVAEFIEKIGSRFSKLYTSEYVDDISIEIVRNTHHYAHENTVSAEVEIYYSEDIPDKEYRELESLSNELQEEVEEYKNNLCKKLEKQGYKEIDFFYSEENIEDFIESNEYEFYENGGIVY